MYPRTYGGRGPVPAAPSPSPQSPRSATENTLAGNVTSISRQLLDSFAFNQVDNLVGDLAHMRQYLVSKLPDSQNQSLEFDSRGERIPESEMSRTVLVEYKGAIYARRCLSTQKIILEYLLGRCLQQCQTCLHEIRETQVASQQVEAATDYVVRYGQEHSRGDGKSGEGGGGVLLPDTDALDAQSANLFKKVRADLCELAEELRFLDGAREVSEDFFTNPESVLQRPP